MLIRLQSRLAASAQPERASDCADVIKVIVRDSGTELRMWECSDPDCMKAIGSNFSLLDTDHDLMRFYLNTPPEER